MFLGIWFLNLVPLCSLCHYFKRKYLYQFKCAPKKQDAGTFCFLFQSNSIFFKREIQFSITYYNDSIVYSFYSITFLILCFLPFPLPLLCQSCWSHCPPQVRSGRSRMGGQLMLVSEVKTRIGFLKVKDVLLLSTCISCMLYLHTLFILHILHFSVLNFLLNSSRLQKFNRQFQWLSPPMG